MFFYPPYQEYFGVLNACRLGVVGTIPLCLGLALPSLLDVGVLAEQLMLAAMLNIKNIMATNSFTAAVVMVNAVGELPYPCMEGENVNPKPCTRKLVQFQHSGSLQGSSSV